MKKLCSLGKVVAILENFFQQWHRMMITKMRKKVWLTIKKDITINHTS